MNNAPRFPAATAPDAPALPAARSYGLLAQTHKAYDVELLRELEDLYVGGYRIQERASEYLTTVNNEHDDVFRERCEVTGYQGFFAQVVDQFVSELFAQPLSVVRSAEEGSPGGTQGPSPEDAFYSAFEKDADMRGHSFVDVVQCAMRTALKQRWALVHVDAPAAEPGLEPMSRLEEERAGLDRVYAYELPVESLINWKRDARGRFEWAVVHAREDVQDGPFEPQGRVRETFTVWSQENGTARWERYALTYEAHDPPHPDTAVPLEDGGATRFRRVPLVALELPDGLWVGNKIGPMQREHWQRRSTLIVSENRSLVAIPVVQLGPVMSGQGGSIPAEVAQDETRGDDPRRQFAAKGGMVLASDDKYGYMEPTGAAYELVDKQLEKLRETMLQVCHQMALSVSPTPGTAQRSGLSKQKDGESTSKVLRALGRAARLFAVQVFDTISECRGDPAEWVAHGLDTYEDDDRELVLEEAAGMGAVPISSPTFRRSYYKLMARKLLPGMDPHDLRQMDDEIDKSTDEEAEHAALEKEAKQAQIEAKKDVAEHPVSHEPQAAPAARAKPFGK